MTCSIATAQRKTGRELDKAAPARPRQISTLEYLSYPPVFSTEARTLDPIDVVREAWKGYLTHMCAPWGMMTGPRGLQPMFRFYFEDQALRTRPCPGHSSSIPP